MPEYEHGENIAEGRDVPPWLTSLADQRLAQVSEAIGPMIAAFPVEAITLVSLTDPKPGQTHEEWNTSCDSCGKSLIGTDRVEGTVMRELKTGHRLEFTYMSCLEHVVP